nr:hypothetical protein [uncultured Holophaga sp.]
MTRHDAKAHRQALTSEQIRISMGLLTPAEREAREKAETLRRQHEAKNAAKGTPLFEEA